MGETNALDRLADIVGIEPSYHDIWGGEHVIPAGTKRDILSSLGLPADDEETAEATLVEFEARRWRRPLEPATLIRAEQQPATIGVAVPAGEADVRIVWHLVEEDGTELAGEAVAGELEPIESRHVDGKLFERRAVVLPETLPEGYHRLTVSLMETAGARSAETSLIVAPLRCWLPPSYQSGMNLWGMACQLYSLRSNRNWGVGNYGDLAEFAAAAAEQGADLLGINPLHALFTADPGQFSPYSPSSREFLNVLYIDVEAVPEFAECAEVRELTATTSFQERLQAAREADLVDYGAVYGLVIPTLRMLFKHFREEHLAKGTERARAFEAFRDGYRHSADPTALERFATFLALQEWFSEQNPLLLDWQKWPEDYQDPESEQVARFAEEHAERVEFQIYLQWLADRQVAAAMDKANRATEGRLMLYLDRAVGVGWDSAATWSDHQARIMDMSIGAPPDPFNQLGQKWGLSPYSPLSLKENAYRSYIAVLRASMRHAGALRIDHIAGLQRLYWVPRAETAQHGAYVRNPFEAMMRILALESQRMRCLVIGEDLGTVPEGLREAMDAAGMLSYKVFQFERVGGGLFRDPGDYPRSALVTAGTHDLPTLKGFWIGRDLEWRRQLDLYPGKEAAENDARSRVDDRRRMLDALIYAGLWPGEPPTDTEAQPMDEALCVAIHRYLARTPSFLLMVSIEDALGMAEQMNLPGTIFEHPNWRRRLPLTVSEIFRDPAVLALMAAVRKERGDNRSRPAGG
jgi:4-alpha-glucanotransferase